MESQLPRSHGHHYEEEPYNTAGLQTVGEGHEGDQQHHEKKSVLGIVKAKAKKIKNTLTKHGHGHDHDHSHDEEDYDEDDEEMVHDPEVHVYDSASVTGPIPPAGVNSGIPKGYLDTPNLMEEDRYESVITELPVRSFGQWQEENSGHTKGNLGSLAAEEETGVAEDKHMSFSSAVHVPMVADRIGNVRGQGEDFSDPIGNENFIGSTGNVRGREENFTDPIGDVRGQQGNLGHSGAGIRGSTGMEEDPHAPPKGQFTPPNYQTKVADPTGTGEEVGLTPILHSLDKMNIYDEPQQKPKQNVYTGSHDQFFPEPTPTNTPTNPREPVPKFFDSTRPENSPLDHLTENPSKPLDRITGNPSNKGSYTQMISSAASLVASKAASAKNVVSSTFGYGGTKPEKHNEMQEGYRDSAKRPNEMQGREEDTKPVGGAATEYTHKIASTVTEKLAPVYGKVAGAGSTVMSKVQGGSENKHAPDKMQGDGEPEKGVSVKASWVEKLRPGDEDKALSEVISGALTNKWKEGGGESGGEGSRGGCEVVLDTVHKRTSEDDGEERRPMGKVTESKAVAEQLGTGGEGVGASGEGAGGGVGVGKGMVDMIKGTVSSWLGKGSTESQTSQGTTCDGNQGTARGEAARGHDQDDLGGRRPRDLSN